MSFKDKVEEVFEEIEKVLCFVIECWSKSWFLWAKPFRAALGSFGQECRGSKVSLG